MTTKDGADSAFHELGLPDADDLVAKSRLIRFLATEIRRRNLTQEEVGDLLGLDQPDASALVNEKLSRFSIRKLMTLASPLGFTVSIRVEGSGTSLDVPYEGIAPDAFDMEARQREAREARAKATVANRVPSA